MNDNLKFKYAILKQDISGMIQKHWNGPLHEMQALAVDIWHKLDAFETERLKDVNERLAIANKTNQILQDSNTLLIQGLELAKAVAKNLFKQFQTTDAEFDEYWKANVGDKIKR